MLPCDFRQGKTVWACRYGSKKFGGRWAEVRMADSLENRNTTLPACAEMVVLGKT